MIHIDGKGHISGRLASTIAKGALEGQKFTICRAEEIIVSGKQFRNRLKFMDFLRKHSNSNPTKHSHIHYRQPSKMFKRIVRGMLPHKTARGTTALNNITVVEGVPGRFATKKLMKVADAQAHIRIKPTMPRTRLGDLCASVGWNADPVVKRLEARRLERATARFEIVKAKKAEYAAAREAKIASLSAEQQAALNYFA